MAQAKGIRIPALCHLKGVTPTGAWRICAVQVQGVRAHVTACSTPTSSGMIVRTDSAKVIRARRIVRALMLSSGNHNCTMASGPENGHWTGFQMQVQERFNRIVGRGHKSAKSCRVPVQK